MGPFLIVFMVLPKFKTSTELNKMASIERDSRFKRLNHVIFQIKEKII